MTKETTSVLIVDDEFSIRLALRTSLTSLGFEIDVARNADEAFETIHSKLPNVVLLDMNMPGMNGVEACAEIRRRWPGIGIIMLTVRDSARDKIEALDSGADDYVVKPFTIGELAARLRAVARRGGPATLNLNPVVSIGSIEVDSIHRTVRKNSQVLHLTPKEYELLLYLVQRAGIPITHADLLKAVWGLHSGNQVEYLRTFVNQLRKKIEDDPATPEYLLTHRFVGYCFRDPDQSK